MADRFIKKLDGEDVFVLPQENAAKLKELSDNLSNEQIYKLSKLLESIGDEDIPNLGKTVRMFTRILNFGIVGKWIVGGLLTIAAAYILFDDLFIKIMGKF